MNQFKLLKKNGELVIMEGIDDPEWSHLSRLKFDDILKAFIINVSKYQKVRLDCFVDGKLSERKVDSEVAVRNLNCPYRISNLQLFIPEIRQICSNIFSTLDILLNCHLYYRPAEEHPAPYYHSDSQHMLAYQMRGESNWMFPLENNAYVRDTTLLQMKNLMLDEGVVKCPERVVTLIKGQFMFVPYAFSHNILNPRPAPSIYLTFGEEEVVLNDAVEFVGEQLLGIGRLGDRYFDEVDVVELQKTIPNLEDTGLRKKIEEMFFKAKMEKFKGGGRL